MRQKRLECFHVGRGQGGAFFNYLEKKHGSRYNSEISPHGSVLEMVIREKNVQNVPQDSPGGFNDLSNERLVPTIETRIS